VAHISRKELKTDRIRETLAHGAESVASHTRLLWITGAVALAVILAVIGWRFYSERQAVKATAALEEAMHVWEARIRAIGEPEEPGEITYVDEQNKYADAAEKFSAVAQQYSRTRPGLIAQYYAALSLLRIDKKDDAEKHLRELERSGVAEYAALARFQLAKLLAATGREEEGVRLLRQLIEQPTALVPKPLVMLALADHFAASNREEAEKLYAQVAEEFPETTAADEAEKRLDLLRSRT
jgi:predicted negative regulator of RcsB-dependent stress response